MECPKCHSVNTQRLEVIHESGTYDISTVSRAAGIGLGGESVDVRGAVINTEGTSKSLLAKRCGPPEKQDYMMSIIIAMLGWGIEAASHTWYWKSFGVLLIVGGVWLTYEAWQYNGRTWPKRYEKWLQSWHCNKCGNIYQTG